MAKLVPEDVKSLNSVSEFFFLVKKTTTTKKKKILKMQKCYHYPVTI